MEISELEGTLESVFTVLGEQDNIIRNLSSRVAVLENQLASMSQPPPPPPRMPTEQEIHYCMEKTGDNYETCRDNLFLEFNPPGGGGYDDDIS